MSNKRNTRSVKWIQLASCVALSACGGGSGDSGDDGPAFSSFEGISTASATLIDTYIDEQGDPLSGVTTTAQADLPSGSVGYEGYIAGSYDGDRFIGTVTLDVQFDDAEVTGTADNFFHETTGAMSGNLSGTGNINASGPQVTVTLTGTLDSNVTQLALDGDFLTYDGIDAAAVAGLVEGNVGTSTVDDGIFVAD